MKRNNIFVRIVAIILCVVMILGIVTAALYAFAADGAALPDTGSASMTWVIVAVVAALAVTVACLVVPKIKK